MKAAAIFPVGTSIGGCPDAIKHILKTESVLDVYLLAGTQAAADAADPQRFVEQIRNEISLPGVSRVACETVEAFNLSETYSDIRGYIAQIAALDYERVYVGITGGTNPMNASLFQAAMAYLRLEVVPMYVQAHGAIQVQNFVASDIRDRVAAEEALAAARSGQIRVASRLGERLPAVGVWKFLRESLNALSDWDDFDYQQASQTLRHQARQYGVYSGDQLLGPLVDTVARISANATRMSDFTRQIRDEQNFDSVATLPEWPRRVAEIGALLVADTLANANRRMVERRYTDSVLRSYRAAECATQMRLLAIRVHPARPNACPTEYRRYVPPEAPREGGKLAFGKGLEFLRSAGQLEPAPPKESVRGLQDVRNHTYLEHGYVRVQQPQAQSCFTWALEICQALLGPDIRQKWLEFEMRF